MDVLVDCNNASAEVPLLSDRPMLNSKLWGWGRNWKPGLLAERPGKAVFLLFPRQTPQSVKSPQLTGLHMCEPSLENRSWTTIFFICEHETIKIGLNGIKDCLYWNITGGETYLHSSCIIFSHCALLVLHHFCRVEAVLALWCFPTFYLWSLAGQSLPHPQSSGWARHPTSEEPVQLLLEKVSLNNVFQI